jgi:hypothetical protein
MALSDDEQRRLDEIERALQRDEAQTAASITPGERRQRRLVAAASAATCVGVVLLLSGLVLTQGSVIVGMVVGVAGLLTVAGAAALFFLPPRRG